MKKKILVLLLSAVILLCALPLASCNSVPEVEYNVITRVVIDAYARVELMVNPKNNVAVVTPLNEAAEILLFDEDIANVTPDKAAEKFIDLACVKGILSKDRSEKVSFSVSGEGEYTEYVKELLEKKIEKKLKKNGVDATVELTAPATDEELRAIILDGYFYTEQMLDQYIKNDLIFSIALARQSCASLPGIVYEDFYFSKMERTSALLWTKSISEIVKGMGDEYTALYDEYIAAYDEYVKASENADAFIYSSFLSSDSEYQKALKAVREATVALSKGGDADAYAAAAAELDSVYNEVKADLKEYTAAFTAASEKVFAVEETFPTEIVAKFRNEAIDIQNKVSEYEDAFGADFAETYRSEIERENATVKEYKEKLAK